MEEFDNSDEEFHDCLENTDNIRDKLEISCIDDTEINPKISSLDQTKDSCVEKHEIKEDVGRMKGKLNHKNSTSTEGNDFQNQGSYSEKELRHDDSDAKDLKMPENLDVGGSPTETAAKKTNKIHDDDDISQEKINSKENLKSDSHNEEISPENQTFFMGKSKSGLENEETSTDMNGLPANKLKPECSDEVTNDTFGDPLNIVGDGDMDAEKEESEDESTLTESEIDERTTTARKFKEEGNIEYKNGNFLEAIRLYSEGIKICPKCSKKDLSVLFSNRSASRVKMDITDDAISDCTQAIELHPQYVKALLRRAQLYEKKEKLDEALKDYEKVFELDKSIVVARDALLRLPGEIEERNEKLKKQMLSSLKDLGNLVLRPFGLSTDNFQLQQDPDSGSYNIQFNNNPRQSNTSVPPNGK